MKNNINNNGMPLLEMKDSTNSSPPLIHYFNIPSGDGIPIRKFNEVTDAISMYKLLSLISFIAIMTVFIIGYIHLP